MRAPRIPSKAESDRLTRELASKQLAKRSVRINDIRREQNVKAFPYFVNFLPYPYQYEAINGATGQYENTAAQAEGPDGLPVPALGILDIPIVMARDAAFHMLYVKYGAWRLRPEPEHELEPLVQYGSREILVSPATSLQSGSLFDATMEQRIPYYSFLDVSFYFPSSGARDYYGGLAHSQFSSEGPAVAQVGVNSRLEIPVAVKALQGQDDGLGMVRMPYQLPAYATMLVRIRNRYTATLNVYGSVFGYKIPL